MTEPTENEHPTCIAVLIFLILLVVGGFAVAFLTLTGPLAWCVGMLIGFLLGVLAAVEFQIDKEKRHEPTNS